MFLNISHRAIIEEDKTCGEKLLRNFPAPEQLDALTTLYTKEEFLSVIKYSKSSLSPERIKLLHSILPKAYPREQTQEYDDYRKYTQENIKTLLECDYEEDRLKALAGIEDRLTLNIIMSQKSQKPLAELNRLQEFSIRLRTTYNLTISCYEIFSGETYPVQGGSNINELDILKYVYKMPPEEAYIRLLHA